jgi:hypothetical protein
MATYRVFKLEIITDGSAFGDDDDASCAGEIARILRSAADNLESGGAGALQHLWDWNGNCVGSACLINRCER